VDLIVKSPGVSPQIPFLDAARAAGVPIVGELEISSLAADGPIVAITGTNGKSTTTAWVGHMLVAAGMEVEVAGNIGRPFAEAVLERPHANFVVEVSSFQLEDTRTFRPRVATLLNLTPDHLDRHGSMDAYAEAKSRIFRNQTGEDFAVLGPGPELDPFAVTARARVLRTGRTDPSDASSASGGGPAWANPLGPVGSNDVASGAKSSGGTPSPAETRADRSARHGSDGVRLEGDVLVLRLGGQAPERLLRSAELALPGAHNLENAMAAAATAAAAGVPTEAIVRSLRTFPGLAHRLEPVGEVGGVICVNDSKATNVSSLQVALEAFPAPVHLIAGGVGKGQDFRPVAALVRDRTRSVHLIGESAAVLAEAWAGAQIHRAGSLEGALDAALTLARPGERVLLSPGCASFDMFRDFEDRGDQFRALVAVRAAARGGSDE
jgi:UDP-N-acetylmuramoylalanine--D-glutamate ligase